MADQRLRGLEREAARGDADARARLLLERVRLGELALPRLRLLAYAGDAVARRALGADAPRAPDDVRAWVLGLEPWGADACVRVAAAIAREVLPAWEATHDDRRPREALGAIERWLVAPAAAAARECRLRADDLWTDAPHGRDVGPWFVVAAAAWAPPPWRLSGTFGETRLVAEAAARCASLALGEDLPYYLDPGSVRACLEPARLRDVAGGALRVRLDVVVSA